MVESLTVSSGEMADFVVRLFNGAGLSVPASRRLVDILLEADMSGRGSHGLLQADAYLARLIAGSMTTCEEPLIVAENGGVVTLDAAEMEGHLAAESAMRIAVGKAREYGIAAVAMRRCYHIGVAGHYVRSAAEQGCVAMLMCNTKPVMAAPGGAEKLVGTNPLAIAFPAADGPPVVLDMATTAGTVGRIRQALASGKSIPEGWALDSQGNPTTDAAAALEGILLPMGGAKGFGLSLVIDMLAGLLSSGGWGPKLGEMRGDLSKTLNSAVLAIVMDISHFRTMEGFLQEAAQGAERVRTSRRAEGTERLFTPGERSAEALKTSGGSVTIASGVVKALAGRAVQLNVEIPGFVENFLS